MIVIPLAVFTMVRMGKRLRAFWGQAGQERMGDMASTFGKRYPAFRMVKA